MLFNKGKLIGSFFMLLSLLAEGQEVTSKITASPGERISVTGKWIDPASVSPPKVVPAEEPRTVTPETNTFPAGKAVVVPVDEANLRSVTPGRNGVPMPRQVMLPADTVPAILKPSVPALSPAFKDIATHDIRYLDVDQGMNNSYVFGICEDSRGYLWFGGWLGGAWRYDGISFSSFTKAQGLADDEVNAILEDRNLNLWFATKGGLSKYNGATFTNYTQLPGDIPFDAWTIFEDSKGRLWFSVRGNGLYCFDGTVFTFYTIKEGLPDNEILSITEDAFGHLWFGSATGLCRFDGTSFTHFPQKDVLKDTGVRAVVFSKTGEIWMAGGAGLSKFDGTAFHYYGREQGLPVTALNCLMEDSAGNLWMGATNGGVYAFDGNRFTRFSESEGLSNNDVLALLEDRSGQIWATTYGGGVNKINPKSFEHLTGCEALDQGPINHIMEDREYNLWITTEYSGVVKYDGRSFSVYTKQTGLHSNKIQFILEDSRGNLWFASFSEGVSKYDGKSFTHYTKEQGLPSDEVWAMLEDEKGHIWMATLEGVCRFDGKGFTQFTKAEGLPNEAFSYIYQDHNRNIWLASGDGVFKYDGRSFIRYSRNDGLAGEVVNYILQDHQQNYWFATYDAGISRFDGHSFLTIAEEQGLKDVHVWAMQMDHKNNLWIGTEKGIYLLPLSDGQPSPGNNSTLASTIVPFLKMDGLKSEDIRQHGVCLDHNNQLWWATGKGVSKLDLDQFYAAGKQRNPPVYLNTLTLNETFIDFSNSRREVSKDNGITQSIRFGDVVPFQNYPRLLKTPHDINHIAFEFIAIDFEAPHRIRYQYQLEGLEKNWSQISSTNRAEYRSIPFGNYTFKVRAGTGQDDWGEPLTYSFQVLPPWWYTGWAYAFYLLLFGSLSYLAYYALKRRLLLQNELRLKQEEARQLKELDRFKSRLYTNLTHEFRTPLTVILGMVRQIRSEPNKYLNEGSRLIENNGRNLLRLINQLLDLSKLEDQSFELKMRQGDIVPYLRYLTRSFQTYANQKNLSLRFFTNLESLVMDYDEDQLQQVLTNLISNALKFTPPDGDVLVRLTEKDNLLNIEIRDTGIGIAEKDLPHIFDRFYQVDNSHTRQGEGTGIGLAHTLELVKIMGGDISVDSKPGKGSHFVITLPVIRKAALQSAGQASRNQDRFSAGAALQRAPELSAFSHFAPVNQKKTPAALPRLLLIEDNQDVVLYLKSCLDGLYQIQVAYNGRIGIDKAIEYIPDLIISDVMMPEKDGYEVCDTLKNDERTSHIPIVLLTAKADAPSKLTGLRRGADAYLTKPFDKEELMVRLEMMMERQRRLATYFSKKLLEPATAAPREADMEEAVQVEDAFLQKVRRIVEENYEDEHFALPLLCRKIGMSRSQLFRKMQALADTSPSGFIRSYRLSKAKTLLQTTDLNVSEVAWKVGFRNLGHFSKIFREEFGFSPSETSK